MTQVRARRGDREHDPHPAAKRNRYLELLRAPGALAFSSAGFVGRMSMSMYGLGTVLLIALLTGHYGEAGTVAAAGAVGYAGLSPLIATRLSRASGMGTPSLLCIVGTLLLAAHRRTEPTPKPKPKQKPTRDAVAESAPARRLRPWQRLGPVGWPSLPAAGLVTLAPAFLLFGAKFSAIDLSNVAVATDLGHRPVAGLILGTYAFGSAVGGLWYGSRRWTAPLGRRFTITAALTVAGVSAFWAVPGLLVLDAVGFIAGLAISPTLMTGYAILERQAPPHRTTEAMAWLSSTISVGVAVGSAFSGHIIDAVGARWSFAFAACCGAAGGLICVAGRRRLRTDDDQQQAAF